MSGKQTGVTTTFFGKDIAVLIENVEGEVYGVRTGLFQDILSDWSGDRNLVPANDARILFAAANGLPVNPYEYHQDFKALLGYLREWLPPWDLSKSSISTMRFGSDTVIVTENAEGEIYVINAPYLNDILDDWNGECDFVPANDAKVYFAAWNGKPINPYKYCDFESLILYLKERLF